jgi:hypothetical protein
LGAVTKVAVPSHRRLPRRPKCCGQALRGGDPGLAYDIHPLFAAVPIGMLAILCMAAYLAGVVQAPLTAAVIVSEMTADHALIFPIMVAALLASEVGTIRDGSCTAHRQEGHNRSDECTTYLYRSSSSIRSKSVEDVRSHPPVPLCKGLNR